MAPLRLTLLFVLLQLCLDHVAGPLCQNVRSSFVLLKGSFTFPCDPNVCDRAEWRKILPREQTLQTLATYQNQTCRIQDGFENDFTCEGKHLRLKAAKYTDQGRYEFNCDGTIHSIKLDVLHAVNATVTQMDNITLNCYHAGDTNDVTWLHKNDTALCYKKDGSVTTGEGFEGRVSVEKSCFITGDFSLTITGAQQTDAGLYRCFTNEEATKGDSHAHLLHVNEKCSGPETEQTDSIYRDLKFYKTLTVVLACGIFVIFVIFLIVHFKLWSFIPRITRRDSTTHTAVPEESDSMMLKTVSPQSPVNDHSHQSDPEDKPSSTRPFY